MKYLIAIILSTAWGVLVARFVSDVPVAMLMSGLGGLVMGLVIFNIFE